MNLTSSISKPTVDEKGVSSARACINTCESPSRTTQLKPKSVASCSAEDDALASISSGLWSWGNTCDSEANTLPCISQITTPTLDFPSFVKIAPSKFTLTKSRGGERHLVRERGTGLHTRRLLNCIELCQKLFRQRCYLVWTTAWLVESDPIPMCPYWPSRGSKQLQIVHNLIRLPQI